MMRAATLFFLPLLLLGPLLAQSPGGTPKERRYCARQILMLWKGHPHSPSKITADKEAVRNEARDLVKKLRATEISFADAAKQYSQCPSRLDGGYLGQFRANEYHPDFIAALEGARYQTVIGPIETSVGFVIFERLPIEKPWPDLLNLKHILISYRGAFAAPAGVKRTKDEALRLVANLIIPKIKTNKISFADAAKTYSDDKRSGARGGRLGTNNPSQFVCSSFVDRVLAQSIGEVHGPIESPFGFHIVVRLEVEKPLRAAHILIPYAGASQAGKTTRTEAEAKKLAQSLLEQLTPAKGGSKQELAKLHEAFAALARKHSSCPTGKSGGDLGEFRSGSWVKAFEEEVLRAEVGELRGPVRTRFGYHLILRTQ
ncbi:MAG: hypothetical protein CSA62_02045 [Planctomycetota bacterium]|nr:MAG: hypothetical protein CSA62_02045 [Planctomycetota bacterium]